MPPAAPRTVTLDAYNQVSVETCMSLYLKIEDIGMAEKAMTTSEM
jgi:hypothetical protein